MCFSGASFRFHFALEPVRLVILGLTCTAGHEKVKCEQYGPLGEQSGGGGAAQLPV